MATDNRRGAFYELSEDSRVRVSLMLVLIGGVAWLISTVSGMKSDVLAEVSKKIDSASAGYVSNAVFDARIQTITVGQTYLSDQLRDLRDEIKELKKAR